ncbi:MAG: hypothetical protein FD122_3700 [Stygiobacter sp.]|nr:MAG: hypothetical protein FD122_3700 [Stygiobacter sp.]
MDETFIQPDQGADMVIAVTGSKDVAQRTMTTSFHTTVVACCSADGTVLPPFFVFPGERQPKGLENSLRQQIFGVALAAKGWINAATFLEWLQSFDTWIGQQNVLKPVVLLFDGAAVHLCQPGLAYARTHGIELLCLPANSSHITQPLDVSVFRSFKRTMNAVFRDYRLEQTGSSLSKVDIIKLVVRAWNYEAMGSNAVSGFATTGLWPISKEALLQHWMQFDRKSKVEELPLRLKEKIRDEVLVLPPVVTPPKKRRRKIDTTSAMLLNDCASDDVHQEYISFF